MTLSSFPADRLVGLEKLSAEPILGPSNFCNIINRHRILVLFGSHANYNPRFHSSDGGAIDQSGLCVTSVSNLWCSFVVGGNGKCEFSLDSFFLYCIFSTVEGISSTVCRQKHRCIWLVGHPVRGKLVTKAFPTARHGTHPSCNSSICTESPP